MLSFFINSLDNAGDYAGVEVDDSYWFIFEKH